MNASTSGIGFFNNTTNGLVAKQQYCDEIDDSIQNILYSIFMSLVMVLSLCGNTLVVVSVLMSRILRRRVSSMFIASLGEFVSLSN